MNLFKHHFLRYSKRERNGVFLLLLLIVVFQTINYFLPPSSFESENINFELLSFQQQLDSVKHQKISKLKKLKINPNFISDGMAYELGMSVDEIDRLFEFRESGKYVYSPDEFQKVTQVSDSLKKNLQRYFFFPTAATKKNKRKVFPKKDINTALFSDFLKTPGVNSKLANRLVNYRNRIQGYHFYSQLDEVWGLNQEIKNEILKKFLIQTKPKVEKINLNACSFKELLKHPYLNYNLTKEIIAYRNKFQGKIELTDLKKIEGFPLEKYERIVLYLRAE